MFPFASTRRFPREWILGIALSISPCFSGEVTPPIPPALQQDTHLCWAASDYMVLEYYNAKVPVAHKQCDIVNYAQSTTNCCSSSGTSLCNPFGQSNIRKGIYGLTAVAKNASISWQTIVDGISKNYPFIFSWYWTGGGGHVMAGIGYHTTSANGVITNWVDYNNPLWGRDQISMEFFDHDPNHTTAQTYYNIR